MRSKLMPFIFLFAIALSFPVLAQQVGDKPAAQPAAPAAASKPTPTLQPMEMTDDKDSKNAPQVSKPIPPMQPQPTTVPGRPDIPNAEVAKQLRNVAPLPFGAPPDKLPIPQLKLPKGFKVEVYASGIPNARSLRLGDKGTVFVSNRVLDKVYAIVDKNGKREAKVIASGLDRPNGLAFHKGVLYIAEGTKILKLDNIEDNLDNPPKQIGRASCRERV